MNNFFLRTSTRDREYFPYPAENSLLKEREKIWRLESDVTLVFALVSRNGEVTFSAGPLTSGRRDSHGRPCVNSFVVQSSVPDEKRQMGRIFAAMLKSPEMQVKFAEAFETQIVRNVIAGGEWDGQLPEIDAEALSVSNASFAVDQQLYPANSPDAGECAARIAALIESGRDFAVGCCSSVRSVDKVAQELQQKFGFDWKNTFIAVFSSAAVSKTPLQCPKAQQNVQKKPQVSRYILLGIVVFILLMIMLVVFGRSEPDTQPSASALQKEKNSTELKK